MTTNIDIEKEFDNFFEFDTDNKSTVTSVSCKLFAQYCIDKSNCVDQPGDNAMLSQKKAENLAKNYLNKYLSDCRCQTKDDVANAIMKITSVSGIYMCAVVGNSDAVARLQGITDYIHELTENTTWTQETIN